MTAISSALWRTAQVVGVFATVALLVGLVVKAEIALDVLWNILIPLVPASLLISPAIWRNVCPLATINMLSNRSSGGRTLTANLMPTAGLWAIVLLGVLVPARRFLFNTDGIALAITVTVVAFLALLLGAFFKDKAGFCNAICPILPVERLYGQHPMMTITNPRCIPCTMCTTKGCIDLAPTKSIAQTLGNTRRSNAWLMTGYGVFAAAFPGFVVGYYTTLDGPLGTAGAVYGHVAFWALGSYVATVALVWLFKAGASRAMVVLAAVAAGLYYWYAASTITTAFAIEGAATVAIRIAGLALVTAWFIRAVASSRTQNSIALVH